MHASKDRPRSRNGPARWAGFVSGALLLAGTVLALMQGYTPPGAAGDVFRNNMRQGIDATPLFYTEVESLLPDE